MKRDPGESQDLQKACSGDVDAFASLFEPLRPMVYAVARRLVGPDDADDVVMETYLKAWQALPRFNRRASLKSWVYRIAYNCAVDMVRRDSRRNRLLVHPPASGEARAEPADPGQPRPDENVERSDLAGLVREALKQLKPRHRTTLELRFAEGLTYAEIAAATGTSIGTVMSRLFYGRKKLRSIVEEMTKP